MCRACNDPRYDGEPTCRDQSPSDVYLTPRDPDHHHAEYVPGCLVCFVQLPLGQQMQISADLRRHRADRLADESEAERRYDAAERERWAS